MQNSSVYGVSKGLTRRKITAPSVVVAAASSNRNPADGNVVLVENTLNGVRENAQTIPSSAIKKDSKSAVRDGVEELYGEDVDSEDQYVTPWAVSVAR